MQTRSHTIQRKRVEIRIVSPAEGEGEEAEEANMRIGMHTQGMITTGAEGVEVAGTIRRITPTRIEMTTSLLINVSIPIIILNDSL